MSSFPEPLGPVSWKRQWTLTYCLYNFSKYTGIPIYNGTTFQNQHRALMVTGFWCLQKIRERTHISYTFVCGWRSVVWLWPQCLTQSSPQDPAVAERHQALVSPIKVFPGFCRLSKASFFLPLCLWMIQAGKDKPRTTRSCNDTWSFMGWHKFQENQQKQALICEALSLVKFLHVKRG